jgi:hypothetical protein
MTTHRFPLSDVHYAIKSVGGEGAPGAIHVSVLPWMDNGKPASQEEAPREEASEAVASAEVSAKRGPK